METTNAVLTADELEKAMHEMIRVREQLGSDISKIGDANFVAQQLFFMSKKGQVFKFYKDNVFVGLMAYDVGFLWWLEKPIVIEQLVLSCDKDAAGIQREALKILDWLTNEKYPQTCGVASGCLFLRQPQVVMNGYKKAGFTQMAPTALKIKND